MKVKLIIISLILSSAGCTKTETTLPKLNIDTQSITISGISSGGYMANQYHIAYSEQVSGAAILSAGPFGCAQGDLKIALTACMNNLNAINPSSSLEKMKEAETKKSIAKLNNLAHDKVWIFHGKQDVTVSQNVNQALVEMYRSLAVDIHSEFDLPAGHGYPTENFGVACEETQSPFINNCQYDAAGQLLSYLLGELKPKESASNQTSGKVLPFEQAKFLDAGRDNTLADTGYVYIPVSCESGEQCRIHMALHGCQQNADSLEQTFINHVGLNEWAGANNLVVIYPQTKSTLIPLNPKACWDWWGYTGSDYLEREGQQLKHLNNIVQGLASSITSE